MKRKTFLISLFVIFNSLYILSQATQSQYMTTEYLKKLDKIFISPQVAAFQKYTYYPVSPSTGTTNIQIPIYVVNQGELTHSISLDYHTGGIKVNDVSTTVGLGWLLNAGGAIIRTKQGAGEDENQSKGYLQKRSLLPTQDYLNSLGGMSLYSQQRTNFFTFCKNIVGVQNQTKYGEGIDLEPDVFSYNFAGKTGVFYFSTSGKIVTENKDILNIEFINGYKDFRITDENGVTYLFENKYQMSNKTNSISKLISGHSLYLYYYPKLQSPSFPSDAQLLDENKSHVNGQWYYLGSTDSQYPTLGDIQDKNAWYITKIIHPNNEDTIYFDYKQVYYVSQKYLSHSKEVVYDYMVQVYKPSYDLNLIENSFENNVTDEVLTKIRYKSGEIIFNYAQDRMDSNAKDRLTSIICKNKIGNIIANIELDNNKYFNSNFQTIYDENYNTDPKLKKRLKLEKITFKYENNTSLNSYQFKYNEATLPVVNSTAVDHWGYFNGQNNESFIPKITQINNGTFGNANKTSNENFMKAFVLEKIVYPTGGMTELNYSCHKVFSSKSNVYQVNVGGLKVSSMKLYPNYMDTTNYTKKVFTYSYNGYNDVGKAVSNVGAEFNFQYSFRFGDDNTGSTSQGIFSKSFIINSSPTYSINLPESSNALYDKVIEADFSKTGEKNGRKETVFNLGYLPYYYQTIHTNDNYHLTDIYDYYDPEHVCFGSANSYDNIFFTPVRIWYQLNNRPYLLKESIFDKNNTKIKETIKGYSFKEENSEQVKGFLVSSYSQYQESRELGYFGFPTNDYYPNQYCYCLYSILLGKRFLTSEYNYTLTPNGTIAQNTYYDYEDTNGMLRKTTTTNSDGKVHIYESWYPFDYSSSIPVINTLKNKHILQPAIMQIKKTGSQTVDGETMELNENGEPINIYKLKESLDYSNVIFNANVLIQQPAFEKIAELTNKNGRIVGKKLLSDLSTVYLYSYSNQYPIAEITNTTYSNVEVALGGEQKVTEFANKTNPSLEDIKAFLAPLSTNANTKEAMITTYTYKPLVGILTKTDPRGVTTYYEYDGFGRLQYTKDKDGKILQRFDYHYKE